MHTINRMLALALSPRDIDGHSLLAYRPVPLPTSCKQAPVCRWPSACCQNCMLFFFRSDQDGVSRARDTRQLCLGASLPSRCTPSKTLYLPHPSPPHTQSASGVLVHRPKPPAFLLPGQSVHLRTFLLYHGTGKAWVCGLVVEHSTSMARLRV